MCSTAHKLKLRKKKKEEEDENDKDGREWGKMFIFSVVFPQYVEVVVCAFFFTNNNKTVQIDTKRHEPWNMEQRNVGLMCNCRYMWPTTTTKKKSY